MDQVVSEVLADIARMIAEVDPGMVQAAADRILKSQVLVAFGNGGSYANASHLICDLSLREGTPKVLKAIGDNTSLFSALCNDSSFEEAVAAELERSISVPGEKTVVLFSTSGESKNIVRAARKAKEHGCFVVAMFGRHLNNIEAYADMVFLVDGVRSGRIEAVHAAICHAIAEAIQKSRG